MADSKAPNFWLCYTCDHEEDFVEGTVIEVPMKCPSCNSSTYRLRCGVGPRPRAGRNRRCRNFARPGSRCRKHGRDSLKGAESPTWEHGGRSRYVPQRYKAAYQRAINDPLAQRENRVQLALLDAMQEEALKSLGTGESGAAWRALKALARQAQQRIHAIREAGTSGDVDTIVDLQQHFVRFVEAEILPIALEGAKEEAARGELLDMFIRRSRLLRVQQQGEKVAPVEVFAAMQAQFAALVARYVTDPHILRAVVMELREQALPGWTLAEKAIQDVKAGKGGSEKPN